MVAAPWRGCEGDEDESWLISVLVSPLLPLVAPRVDVLCCLLPPLLLSGFCCDCCDGDLAFPPPSGDVGVRWVSLGSPRGGGARRESERGASGTVASVESVAVRSPTAVTAAVVVVVVVVVCVDGLCERRAGTELGAVVGVRGRGVAAFSCCCCCSFCCGDGCGLPLAAATVETTGSFGEDACGAAGGGDVVFVSRESRTATSPAPAGSEVLPVALRSIGVLALGGAGDCARCCNGGFSVSRTSSLSFTARFAAAGDTALPSSAFERFAVGRGACDGLATRRGREADCCDSNVVLGPCTARDLAVVAAAAAEVGAAITTTVDAL